MAQMAPGKRINLANVVRYLSDVSGYYELRVVKIYFGTMAVVPTIAGGV